MHHPLTLCALLVTLLNPCLAAKKNNNIVSIPYEYTYLLPDGFTSNLATTFANGTLTTNHSLNALLSSASKAPFISYSAEFTALLGSDPEVTRVSYHPGLEFAHEAGVWIPSTDQVLFTTDGDQAPAHTDVLDLKTNTITPLNSTPAILNPNGAYLFDGLVYFTTFESNTTYRGGLLTYSPTSGAVTPLLNSYFGLPFNGLDDVVGIHHPETHTRYLYFTDFGFPQTSTSYTNLPPSVLPNAVWRFDLTSKVLIPVISRADIPTPNGIRATADGKTLYVTDSGATSATAASIVREGGGPGASPAIYKYDVDAEGFPVNRRLFGYAREGIADGLHIDDKGRVWTGEAEGVVVRSPTGKVLGVFNSQFFGAGNSAGAAPLANFALAGNVVVVLGTQQVWTVRVGETLVARDSPLVN